MTTAYDIPLAEKRGEGRRIEANLFVGEWAELLEETGEEAKVNFRGGIGYVPINALGEERTLEVYFIDVGQGDSVLIQTANDERILIDGGRDERAYSFMKWKYNLKKYTKDFEAVIMTHSDEDHSSGLFPILNDKNVLVKRVYHNGIAKRMKQPYLGKEVKVNGKNMLTEFYDDVEDLKQIETELSPIFQQWVNAVSNARERAANENIELQCIRADQNTEPLVLGKQNLLKISFLNPINLGSEDEPKLMDFGSDGETINGNSVAVLVEYGKAKMLLCGDMNAKAEKLFLEHCKVGTPIAHVFKANHHGSQDFTSDFLKAVQPWISVVSSGDDPDYGHPRACLLGSLGRYAPDAVEKPLLFSTEVAATFKKVEVSPTDKAAQLYEKTTHGLINVRTNGEWLAAGRVYNVRRKKKEDVKYAKSLWDWEKYAFDLKNAKPLSNDLHKVE